MKKIIYELLQGIDANGNTVLSSIEMGYSEANIAIAKKEAYNGKYTIEDDGKAEPENTPSQLDILDSRITYLAMMTGNLYWEE